MESVAAALAIRGGRVLLTRRASGQKLEGLWEFPGGKQEEGETIEQCVVRELREELSLSCMAGKIFTESIYQYEGGTIKLIGILVTLGQGELKLTVHDRFEWVQLADVLSYELAPADIPIAEELINAYG